MQKTTVYRDILVKQLGLEITYANEGVTLDECTKCESTEKYAPQEK